MNRLDSLLDSHSIKVRFLLNTLFANICRIGLSALRGVIIARGLELAIQEQSSQK